jgi:hypothetical protein
MLLVLSPGSVDSTNVMDEVSFALEERKLVIPFRLRRVQYIDVRTDYQSGLHELLRILTAGTTEPHGRAERSERERTEVGRVEPPSKDRWAEDVPPVIVKGDNTQYIRHEPGTAARARASSKGTMLLVGGIAAVLLVLGGAMTLWKSSTDSTRDVVPTTGAITPQPTPTAATISVAPSLGSEWVKKFMDASQGPSAATARPYFAETVRPYYGLASADWAAIEREQFAYRQRFPTIRMTVIGDPRIQSAEQGKVVDVDIAYENTKKDGQIVQGTDTCHHESPSHPR